MQRPSLREGLRIEARGAVHRSLGPPRRLRSANTSSLPHPTTNFINGITRSLSARRSNASRMFICATSVCSVASA